MTKYFHISLALIVLTVTLAAGTRAQTGSTQRLIANIPFNFSVGKKLLPAGEYAFKVVNPSSDQRILQVQSLNGPASAIVQTTTIKVTAADDAKLIFERYGDRYFFSQAQLAGEPNSLAAVQTKAERAEKRALTTSRVKQRMVVIIAE